MQVCDHHKIEQLKHVKVGMTWRQNQRMDLPVRLQHTGAEQSC